jgi:hypothetical protein
VNSEAPALDTCFSSEVRQFLERFDEFRAAIGVAAVVDCVYADENIIGRNDFRPGECIREEDRVTRGDVGDRNALRDFCFRALLWNGDIVGQCRAGEYAQVDLRDAMLLRA